MWEELGFGSPPRMLSGLEENGDACPARVRCVGGSDKCEDPRPPFSPLLRNAKEKVNGVISSHTLQGEYWARRHWRLVPPAPSDQQLALVLSSRAGGLKSTGKPAGHLFWFPSPFGPLPLATTLRLSLSSSQQPQLVHTVVDW